MPPITKARADRLISTVDAFLMSANSGSDRVRRLELIRQYVGERGDQHEFTLDEMVQHLERETLPSYGDPRGHRRLQPFCKDLFEVAAHGL